MPHADILRAFGFAIDPPAALASISPTSPVFRLTNA